MTIFMISRGFPSETLPQWGCFEKDQAEALAALGHNVIMLSVDSRFGIKGRKYGLSINEHNNVKSVNLFVIPGAVMDFCQSFKRFIKMNEYDYVYRKAVALFGEPDIIYSHYLFVSEFAVLIAAKYDKPIVAIEHWSEINKDFIDKKVQLLGNRTYKYVDGLISVAEPLRDSIKRHFGIDSVVVHNMTGKEFCYAERQCSKHVIKYVTTGSLIYRKGFDVLISAFSKADLLSSSWHLDIIGEGEERRNLEDAILKSGLDNNISLLGRKSKNEIVKILQGADVFVLPSRNENFSVAVLEALACGLPVIASVCGGIRECIDEQNGLLFPVDDVDALTNCIQKMQITYTSYNRKSIADNCKEQFSPETIAKKLVDVFENVLFKRKYNNNQ